MIGREPYQRAGIVGWPSLGSAERREESKQTGHTRFLLNRRCLPARRGTRIVEYRGQLRPRRPRAHRRVWGSPYRARWARAILPARAGVAPRVRPFDQAVEQRPRSVPRPNDAVGWAAVPPPSAQSFPAGSVRMAPPTRLQWVARRRRPGDHRGSRPSRPPAATHTAAKGWLPMLLRRLLVESFFPEGG